MNHTYYRLFTPSLPMESLRIAQVSDVHFSKMTGQKKNQKLIRELRRNMQFLRPDVIAVTGDLVSRNPGATGLADAAQCLAALQAFAPVLYIFGNHEADLPKDQKRELLRNMLEMNITVLNNRTVSFGGVEFAGFVLPHKCYKSEKGSYSGLLHCGVEHVEAALGTRGRECTVLLSHNPMAMQAYAKWGADVVLSGHVHGGIIRLPLIGGLLSPERRFFPQYTKGIYRKSKTTMVVSAGIGKFRLWNPPEVLCIDLVSQKT